MSTPDASNLSLGAGDVWFDRFDTSGNSSGSLRHLGNVEELSTSMSVDTITKKSSMSGARGILAEVITGSDFEVSMTLDEYETNNLSLALLGTEGAFTQTAAAGIVGRVISAAIVLDVWYELKDANGLGAFNPTVTAFKQGATTLAAAAYDFRADCGMVRFLSSYVGANNAVAGASTTWDGSIPAVVAGAGQRIVQALAVGKIQGRLRYRSADDQAQGKRIVVDFWKLNLKPDGDLNFISDDFGTFKLKGAAQIDTSKAVGQQYARIVTL
jgi:hypothetical protein